MNMTDRELLKQALDALEGVCGFDTALRHEQVIAAIRARLEQKDDEPVGYVRKYAIEFIGSGGITVIDQKPKSEDDIPLYLHPPAKNEPLAWTRSKQQVKFYMIEKFGKGWLTSNKFYNFNDAWTIHAEDAIQFCDKESADAAIKLIGTTSLGNTTVTEHIMCNPPAKQDPLTEDEIDIIYKKLERYSNFIEVTRAIEKAHGIGE